MHYKWLYQQSDAKNVIVFFSGWGFDESVITHLTTKSDTDVLFVSDYASLDSDLPALDNYVQRYLIAWSFGVGSYALWRQLNTEINFAKKVAINGTPQAIHRQFGIAGKVVQHTIERLSAQTFSEFVQRCGGIQKNALDEYAIKVLKYELEKVNQREYPSHISDDWHKAWISQHDQIFPVANQQRAWHNTEQTLINAPHMPFDIWSDWQDLLA